MLELGTWNDGYLSRDRVHLNQASALSSTPLPKYDDTDN